MRFPSSPALHRAAAVARRLPWVLLPPACRHCGRLLEPLGGKAVAFPYLCNPCHDALPWRADVEEPQAHGPIDRVWAPWQYVAPVRQWIWQYKYQRRDGWARCLADLAAEALGGAMPEPGFTHLAPVPLHRRRFQWRGFNQSLLLAHHWRRRIAAAHVAAPPLAARLLMRTRHTRPQMELDAGDRQDNVAGAFAVTPRYAGQLEGARVLLVDDVMTTGATLTECAAVIKAAGAESVDALVIARA